MCGGYQDAVERSWVQKDVKPLVGVVSTKNPPSAPWGLHVSVSVSYTAVLGIGRETVLYLSGLLAVERRRRGTRRGRRALSCFRQAVLVLRCFLDGTRVAQLATDYDIDPATGYRYLHEGIDTRTTRAPDLQQALTQARRAGLTHLSLDGMLIDTDRVTLPGPSGHDLWWSGKHRHHGGNIQVLSTPDGWPLWVSEVRPGREHDLTTACSPPWPPSGLTCPPWPISATKEPRTSSTSRSRNPPAAR